MTGKEICDRARALSNVKYWYGGKGEIATSQLAARLRKENPNVWTEAYFKRALADVGQRVGDCSFLVCEAYEIPMIGSYQLAEKFPMWNGTPRDGMICWKRGHVGIYENGRVHELKSQARDYQFNLYNRNDWEAILYSPDVNYQSTFPEDARIGWHKDAGGWFYRFAEGFGVDTYYRNTVQRINGHLYHFDGNGYICYLLPVRPSDTEGWVE